MTDEFCYIMMNSKCFYCGFLSTDTLNGIDRLDSSLYYEKDNCVSCCKICNFMKTCLDPLTFIKRCKHICLIHNNIGEKHEDTWRDTQSVNYQSYLKRATKKELEFNLTKNEFDEIISQNCHYCKKENSKTHNNGIDRKDNNIGYILSNCMSCCAECNYMKSNLSYQIFIEQCKKITENIDLSNIDKKLENIQTCTNSLQISNKSPIEKTKIIISKQQPNKPIIYKIHKQNKEVKQREYHNGTNLSIDCLIKPEDIPKYCYYIPETKLKGDGFCCSKYHPLHKDNNKDWSTTKSKKVSIQEKYKQLLEYLQKDIIVPNLDNV
jgi:hypothetical protein